MSDILHQLQLQLYLQVVVAMAGSASKLVTTHYNAIIYTHQIVYILDTLICTCKENKHNAVSQIFDAALFLCNLLLDYYCVCTQVQTFASSCTCSHNYYLGQDILHASAKQTQGAIIMDHCVHFPPNLIRTIPNPCLSLLKNQRSSVSH